MSLSVVTKENITGGSTSNILISAGSNYTSGATLVLFIIYSNSDASGKDLYTGISDDRGNTWISRTDIVQSPLSSMDDGVVMRCFSTNQDSSAIQSGDTIKIDFSSTISTYIGVLYQITSVNTITYKDAGSNSQTTSLYPSITTSTLSLNDIVLAATGGNFNGVRNADSDTTNGSWSTDEKDGIDGPPSMEYISQYKIITGSGAQTYNPTFTNDGSESGIEIVSGWIAFTEDVPTPSGSTLYVMNMIMST